MGSSSSAETNPNTSPHARPTPRNDGVKSSDQVCDQVPPDSNARAPAGKSDSTKSSRSSSARSKTSAVSTVPSETPVKQTKDMSGNKSGDVASQEKKTDAGNHTAKHNLKAVVSAGTIKGGKRTSKWERHDLEHTMAQLNMGDAERKWYEFIDALISDEEPVVQPNTKRKGWRTVRLFISSTFKDMHSEREHLVKVIIPLLRQWCEERKVHLIECDLRWGVPKDADTRETLLTCLSEIDRCRQENEYAYFLSMLSERYGYVMDPKDVPEDIKARYKWMPGMSVTSLEIMTGAYWDKNPNALFLMRKPNFLQRVDEDVEKAYAEKDPSAVESLKILKDKVKQHFPDRVVEYDATVEGREGNRMLLGNLDHFGKVILEHFKDRIALQYPELPADQVMSETEIKRADQEDFMVQRSEVLLGREEEVKQMDDYIKGTQPFPGHMLALVGYPGAGKSALMAFAAKKYLDEPDVKVFFHFVGVTPDSTALYSVLSRIYRECMPDDQQDSIPLDADEMSRFTPAMFEQAVLKAKEDGFPKLVIFIDALNQLDDEGNSHKLNWLPRQLPEGLRVIVSTLEGECLDALRGHSTKAQEIAVNPLNTDIRKRIVGELLQTYNKRLDAEQLDILVKKSDAGRPLFLSIACEELRVFGEFRRLTEKVRQLSDDLSGLVEIVLRRTVEEFGGDRVQATLCLIETSRFGLEEEELLHLLSAQPAVPKSPTDCTAADFKDKLHMAVWGFIYVGLRPFLRPSGSSGEGRLDFYHRSISKVVRKMYLTDETQRANWHGRLVQFFLACPDVKRKAEELPYHYIALGNQDGLRRCLLTRDMFEHLYTETNKQTLMRYWQAAGGYQVASECHKKFLQDCLTLNGLEGTREGELLSTKVAWFLVDIGEYDAAEELLGELALKLSDKYGEDATELADPLHAMLTLLMRKALKYVYGSHPGYSECVQRGRALVDLTVKTHRKLLPPTSEELATVLSLCGYFKASLLEEAKKIFEAVNNKVGLAVVLYNLGEKNQYNPDMSIPIGLFTESLALCKLYFGTYHLNTARCVQLYGQLYWNNWISNKRRDWLEESLKHYTLELDILEEILGHDHPTTVRSREDVIIIMQNLGMNDEASKLEQAQPDTREGIA
ncbi:hypothetical protein BaRGS_00014557 [Batillaria attramentaria]|uniref:AAA+ ATPase domain-containing protein n=1 Tax=Batillaria attramentaria TaxID=370345 RepID=A0ABD0L555_9CAEN